MPAHPCRCSLATLQQMRQKNKQQAKMEATQKLEQVKSEQLHLQQQQQRQVQRLAHPLSPDSGSRSPIGSAPPSGATSPLQPREHRLQGAQSSGPVDDVFLRPQAPPPSGYPHSPHPSSPLHQPPSSPQVFSPPSSRPSSPWDPYGKVVGTPRPAPSQAANQQQQRRCSSLTASPAHDAIASPAPSPDSKSSESSRGVLTQPGRIFCSCFLRPPPLSPPSQCPRTTAHPGLLLPRSPADQTRDDEPLHFCLCSQCSVRSPGASSPHG